MRKVIVPEKNLIWVPQKKNTPLVVKSKIQAFATIDKE